MDLRLPQNNLSPYMTRISAAPLPFLFYMADQMMEAYLSLQTSIKRHKNPKLEKNFVALRKKKKKYLVRQEQIHVASL